MSTIPKSAHINTIFFIISISFTGVDAIWTWYTAQLESAISYTVLKFERVALQN